MQAGGTPRLDECLSSPWATWPLEVFCCFFCSFRIGSNQTFRVFLGVLICRHPKAFKAEVVENMAMRAKAGCSM